MMSSAYASCKSRFIALARSRPDYDVIARVGPRLQVQHPTAKAKVARLIESGAFADATLAVLELELPQWKLRRLIYEDGEWHRSLSKHIGPRL